MREGKKSINPDFMVKCKSAFVGGMKLGKLCILFTDGDWIESKDQSDSGIRLIQTGNIGNGEFLYKNDKAKYISVDTFKRLNCKEVFPNDILVSRLPEPVGRGCIIPDIGEKMITAVDCTICRINENLVDRKYFCYFLESNAYKTQLEQHVTGTTRKRISRKNLSNVEIDIPEQAKQKDVVYKLDRLKKIIQNYNRELDLLDELVRARFVEMFGDISINDKNWNNALLGELCKIVRGGSPRPIEKFLGGEVPWIKIGDATKGDNIYLHSTKEHIISEGVSKSRLVKAGSLIFANCGVSLGFARIITFDGCIHDGWLALEDIDERLDKVFLLQSLNQMTEHFRSIAPAGTQPNLNTAIMKKYRQVIPPIELQREFIVFCEEIDKSRSRIQKSLEASQELFDSLMQDYFG